MSKIALVANDCSSRSLYLQNYHLPPFYMEDFSVLGLLVEKYEEACALLQKDGYTLLEANGGCHVKLVHPGQIINMIDTLRENGISTELSDIADTIYQA